MLVGGKGAMAQGQIKRAINPRLQSTLPNVNTSSKENSHGEEEEESEEDKVT